jgi:hypothetical protein
LTPKKDEANHKRKERLKHLESDILSRKLSQTSRSLEIERQATPSPMRPPTPPQDTPKSSSKKITATTTELIQDQDDEYEEVPKLKPSSRRSKEVTPLTSIEEEVISLSHDAYRYVLILIILKARRRAAIRIKQTKKKLAEQEEKKMIEHDLKRQQKWIERDEKVRLDKLSFA